MFPCIYIYSIYCGDIYELNARSAPGAPALGSRLPRGPRQPSFPNRLCYQFYLIWAIFFFPAFSPCSPLLPNFFLNPGESKELGKMPELANLMPQPMPGPGGESRF